MQQIIKLNNLVTTCFRRKHIIVLNPKEEYEIKEMKKIGKKYVDKDIKVGFK